MVLSFELRHFQHDIKFQFGSLVGLKRVKYFIIIFIWPFRSGCSGQSYSTLCSLTWARSSLSILESHEIIIIWECDFPWMNSAAWHFHSRKGLNDLTLCPLAVTSKLGIALSRLALEQSTSLHKSLQQVIVLCLWTINLVCENSWSYVFDIFVDSEGEEEHPQQVPVNNVSSYDQTKQEQAIVQDIPSENLYYAESGQTNG